MVSHLFPKMFLRVVFGLNCLWETQLNTTIQEIRNITSLHRGNILYSMMNSGDSATTVGFDRFCNELNSYVD